MHVYQEEREVSSGKGNTAHFVWRCSNCKRESSAKFEPVKPYPYSADANGSLQPLVVLDCRGLEFIGFDPKVRLDIVSLIIQQTTTYVLGRECGHAKV